MKVATMATGGIGGFLGVKLANAGHDVAMIARGAHLQAIRENGLVLDGASGVETGHPWRVTDDPAEVGPVDVIFFAVKGGALEDAARACLPMLGQETLVVPFLNGVEASERLAEIIPRHHVAKGVAKVSTAIAVPGRIKQSDTFNSFEFAEWDSRPSARIDALRAALNAAGTNAPEVADIDAALWFKFVLFTALSGVTAAGRCTVGDVVATPQLAELYKGVLAETAAVGRAMGVDIPEGTEAAIWTRTTQFWPGGRASTAIDIEAGRPIEIDWISGAAVRLGARVGVPTPLNAALYGLLLPHREGRGG